MDRKEQKQKEAYRNGRKQTFDGNGQNQTKITERKGKMHRDRQKLRETDRKRQKWTEIDKNGEKRTAVVTEEVLWKIIARGRDRQIDGHIWEISPRAENDPIKLGFFCFTAYFFSPSFYCGNCSKLFYIT